MAKKPRRQVYPLETYLRKIVDESIRSDQDVQRLSGQWDNNMVNELMVTVLTDDYIPPIILGEEVINDTAQLWIIEGLQRSSSLSKFRYNNYKITSNVEDYLIEYQRKHTDEYGNIKKDEGGNIIWENVEFDIRNKAYEELPEELKNRVNEYQLETVIHEECTMQTMSKLVRRYNNHKPMNASQKAFTYIDNFARDIRNITGEHRFFKDFDNYTQKEKENGTLERIVSESVMAMFHLDNWQKQSKKRDSYLNQHSSKKEFVILKKNLDRLEKLMDKRLAKLFNSKNSFIWIALFDKFTKLNIEDAKFKDFINEFMNNLHSIRFPEYNNETFDSLDANKSTKDKSIVIKKMNILEQLMMDYLHTNTKEIEDSEIKDLDFVKENVNSDVTEDDIEEYTEVLDGLTLNVDNSSKLLEERNALSLVALVAYSFDKNIDLDEWIVDFFKRKNTYIRNQKENYLYMREDLDKYVRREKRKAV